MAERYHPTFTRRATLSDSSDGTNTAFPLITPDVFGQILSAADVRQALDTTVQTWAATYIAELAYTSGQPLTPFGTWSAQYTDRTLPADLTAACWTTCWTTDPKMIPERQGAGVWRAWWHAYSNLVVAGTDWASAADLMGYYLAAVRAAVLQHRSLGDFATNTQWLGEAMRPGDTSGRRTTQTGVIQWRIEVDGMVNDLAKPPLNTVPGTPGVTVTSVDATLTKEPIA